MATYLNHMSRSPQIDFAETFKWNTNRFVLSVHHHMLSNGATAIYLIGTFGATGIILFFWLEANVIREQKIFAWVCFVAVSMPVTLIKLLPHVVREAC